MQMSFERWDCRSSGDCLRLASRSGTIGLELAFRSTALGVEPFATYSARRDGIDPSDAFR